MANISIEECAPGNFLKNIRMWILDTSIRPSVRMYINEDQRPQLLPANCLFKAEYGATNLRAVKLSAAWNICI